MKYKGILSKKTNYRTAQSSARVRQSDERTQARIGLEADFAKRVEALFDEHNVEHGDWRALAIKLAVAHVKGFQTGLKLGRKNTWDPWDRALLWVTIDEHCKKKPGGMSITKACSDFARRSVWKSKVRSKGGVKQVAEALRKHYYKAAKADKRYINDVRDIRAWGRTMTIGVAKAKTATRSKVVN